MSKIDHIQQLVANQIEFFRSKRNYNRSRVLWLSVTSASLSALATVAIGATKIVSQEWLQLVALVSTAIATVVGVWESVFAFRKLWNLNNTALADLCRLQRLIEYRLAGRASVTEPEVDEFFNELERILITIDQAWVDTYATK